ncbi:hypothetical protein OAQ99_01515 [Candidatus Kapabacteria bacterium]|nr:hypothetical protein [Candidatus Kapabacteria bacterium]
MEQKTITAQILNNWSKVKQINQNSFLIKGGGAVAIGTQIKPISVKKEPGFISTLFGLDVVSNRSRDYNGNYIYDFGIKKLSDSSPLKIYSRTSPNGLDNKNLGINIEVTNSTIALFDGNELINEVNLSKFQIEETKRIILINNNNYIKVSLDCDEMFNYKTNRPISEYLIFESVGSGDWEINAVTMEKNIPNGIFKNRVIIK